jgi:Ser/Thr protein kinase RdoA (MazF antagonist)
MNPAVRGPRRKVMLGTAPASSLLPSSALARSARAFLDRYDLPPDVRVELLHQSENTLYLVRAPSDPRKLVLRVHSHRMRYHTEPSIRSELHWMAALRADAGIETPQTFAARDGSQVGALPGTGRLAVLFSYLEGAPPPETALVSEFERLGEITARMHRHAMGWTPPAWFQRHDWTPDTILGEGALWGRWESGIGMDAAAVEIIGRAAATIGRRLGSLARDRARFGLIHADMRLANLLVERDRTKVIDFDDCGFGWYAYDLATALSFIQERPEVPALIGAWREGYERVARLPPDIAAEIPSFIMLRRINEIAWLGATQHVEFARSLAPRFAADSCRLAEDYLRGFG